MASQYQHRQFFHRVPDALLAHYFESRDVDLSVDFCDLTETQVEPNFESFTALPEEQQADMEVDFQDINALASDSGIDALRNEAAFYEDATFPEAVSSIDGLHAKAVWAFLHKPECWKGAAALLHADTVAGRSWKKRNDLPHITPLVEPEDEERLEKALIRYFRTEEGRGRHCQVDVFRRREKEYFFAYLTDFGKSEMEFGGTAFNPRARTPAFEIIVDTFINGDARYTPNTARREVKKLETAASQARTMVESVPGAEKEAAEYVRCLVLAADCQDGIR